MFIFVYSSFATYTKVGDTFILHHHCEVRSVQSLWTAAMNPTRAFSLLRWFCLPVCHHGLRP